MVNSIYKLESTPLPFIFRGHCCECWNEASTCSLQMRFPRIITFHTAHVSGQGPYTPRSLNLPKIHGSIVQTLQTRHQANCWIFVTRKGRSRRERTAIIWSISNSRSTKSSQAASLPEACASNISKYMPPSECNQKAIQATPNWIDMES